MIRALKELGVLEGVDVSTGCLSSLAAHGLLGSHSWQPPEGSLPCYLCCLLAS